MYSIQKLHSLATTIEEEGLVSHVAKGGLEASKDGGIGTVAEIYHKVRPFLEFFSEAFFVPKKWRTVLVTFLMTLDGLFPPVEEQE